MSSERRSGKKDRSGGSTYGKSRDRESSRGSSRRERRPDPYDDSSSSRRDRRDSDDVLVPSAFGTSSKLLKVSSKSNVKTVAGGISHTSRAGESPILMATGKDSVNQAVKSIAIARGYLEENKLDLSVYPEFRDDTDTKVRSKADAVSFVLTKSALRSTKAAIDENSELRVAQNSEPSVVAGSIAGKIRSGDRVSIVCLGAGSVNQTVKSVIVARKYLAKDAIDICFRPEFIHLKMQDGERSAIRFVILAQQI